MGITDRREIRFEADTVLTAIAVQPTAAAALGLPAVAPNAARFVPPKHHVVLLYRVGAGEADFTVSVESLGALLIGFCCKAGISLPRSAKKTIRIEEDSIVLAFTVDIPTQRFRHMLTSPP